VVVRNAGKHGKKDIIMKVLLAFPIALAAVFLAWSRTKGSHAKHSQLDGVWELVSGQPLPKGTRDIKIISGGHFIFVAYDTGNGRPLYTAGGTYILNGSSYTEHMDFASDEIAAGLVGKDQPFTVKVDGDTFTQTGTLSNGKGLSEIWKWMN
jgi:hypothetical protein